MNVLEELLADSDFSEAVSLVPAGVTASTSIAAARVVRESSNVQHGDRRVTTELRAIVKVLATVHATYGGLAAPAVGDNWTLAMFKGGTGVDGWMAGAAVGHDGWWEVPVVKTSDEELGKRKGPQ